MVVYDNATEPLLHLGEGGLALGETSVVDLVNATSVPIVGLPLGAVVTVRADPTDGFLVVKTPAQQELWHVDSAGNATSPGTGPAPKATRGEHPRSRVG